MRGTICKLKFYSAIQTIRIIAAKKMKTQVSLDGIGQLVSGTHSNPSELLGPHPVDYQGRKALAVRTFMPGSERVWLVDPASGTDQPMRRLHPAGFYEAIWPAECDENANYLLKVARQSGEIVTMPDPYAVEPMLQELDRYLLGEGRHYEMYRRLGAHERTIDGTTGVNFSVWAPNAHSVQVVGDFNFWDGRQHTMKVHPNLGVWIPCLYLCIILVVLNCLFEYKKESK